MSYLERYLTPLLPFIIDTSVLELAINADGRLWVERAGHRYMASVDVAPWSKSRIRDLALQIANSAQEKLTDKTPIVSTTIRAGDADLRAQVTIAPAVIGGAAISFRVFRGAERAARPHSFSFLRDPFRSLEEERREVLHKVVAEGKGEDVDPLLKAIVENRLNAILSGGTSTGKTELGRRLLSLIDPAERIVTIEDSAELLPALPNVVSLIASREVGSRRSADALLQASLRLRPDRIILGELRGSEAATFLDAINTGHSGSFTTIHAETARKAMERLALLVLATGTRLGFEDVIRYLANSIDVIVQMGHQDGRRGIMEIYFPGLGD